jgi:alkanesulfonate monooxygenase SsuD/methylene tetrahydromethanopterin reductase-like flavin-dependent oxidoreductase (luciferase family)
MRLGVVTIPRRLPPGGVPMIDHFVSFAQKVEELDFHGLWLTDAFGRGTTTIDPLSAMGALCAVTKKIELGTCVIQVPIRHPVEHAHRVQTINLLSGGRFRFGVGTGSTKADFDAVQADFDTRFKVLPGMLEVMRRTWNGEPVYGPAVSVWPGTEGGPPVLLGAWRSPRWINLAAHHCQGWIASGIHSKWEDVEIGHRMYREAGGQRAIVANIFADFREDPEGSPIGRPLTISLIGQSPAEARDQLRRLGDIGIDDALIVCPFDDPAQLETIRSLV